jgi:PAS domain S-box-containing protein
MAVTDSTTQPSDASPDSSAPSVLSGVPASQKTRETLILDEVSKLERAARRAALLQELTAALSRALAVQQAASIVAAHGRELFEATATLVYLIEGDDLRLAAFAGASPNRTATFNSLPLSAQLPLPIAVRTGEALWFEEPEVLLRAYPELAGIRLDGQALQAVVALPVRDSEKVIGGIGLSFYSPQRFDALQREFLLTVASQCGQALERARLFEAERAARTRLEQEKSKLAVLAEAGEILSASLHSSEALTRLAKVVVPTLADWCAIDELGPNGKIRRVTVEHSDPSKVSLAYEIAKRYPTDPSGPYGLAKVLRTGETDWTPEVADEILVALAADQDHLAILRSLGLTSYAVVPIVARRRIFGALTLVQAESGRRFTAEDVRLASDIARRAALALENARLYEAADAARAQLHRLFMEAPAAICIGLGRDHRFELANEPFTRLIGRRGLIGKTLREVLPNAEGDRILSLVQAVYDTGQSTSATELSVRRIKADERSSEVRYFNVVFQARRDPGGQIDGVATFAFDVTEQVLARQRSEALLESIARSEARLRALVDATAAIVWTANADGQVVEPSPTWLSFTGQTEAEYLNGGFVNAIHEEDREATTKAWVAAMSSRAPYAAEYRLRRRDGTYAYTLARGTPVLGASGQVIEYVGCNFDITELRRAEAAAREHADTLATVNELGRLISAELDLGKVVQAVTDAATSLTAAEFGAFFYNVLDDQGARYMLYALSGVPREMFENFPMPRSTALFAPTFGGEGVVRLADVTKDPRYGKNAPHHGMPEGHLPVRSYLAVPVTSRSGEVVGGIFLGHSSVGVFNERAEALAAGLAAQAAVAMDNARLFEEAQRLIRALEKSNRELDQFAYVTSHDLKAPLRGITSLAEWLEEDLGTALDDDGRRKMSLLRGRVRRMEGLIQGILEYSRAGRRGGKREEVDVKRLLDDVIEMLAPKPPAAVVIEGSMPTLRTERVALQQVLMNLIGNALKHAERPDAEIRVEARDAGDAYEFRVRDNGPGIAPEFHDRIWGIFQTLQPRDKVESTGIGLAIVKKIVEAQGGRVAIESALGAGATFLFTWPKHDDRRA